MKTAFIFFIAIYLIFFVPNSYSQFPCNLPDSIFITDLPGSGYSDAEIAIFNQTLYQSLHGGTERADSIKIAVFPVGAFFNGINPFTGTGNKYSPTSSHRVSLTDTTITGKETTIKVQSTQFASKILINFDRNTGEAANFSIGYGKYKIEFYRTVLRLNDTTGYYWDWEFANYVYIDLRDFAEHPHIPNTDGSGIDFRIDYFNKDTITFQHDLHYNNDYLRSKKFWHIDLVNKNIVKWELYGTCIPPLIPDRGLFTPDTTNNGVYLKWPINANKYNGNLGHKKSGRLRNECSN